MVRRLMEFEQMKKYLQKLYQDFSLYYRGDRIITLSHPLIGYKKVMLSYKSNESPTKEIIATLEIPAGALVRIPPRWNFMSYHKYRASEAKVVNLTYQKTGEPYTGDAAHSLVEFNFFYKIGEVVKPTHQPFSMDRFDDCASGIHFFLSRKEAEGFWL
jgi:hypothetical protein